MNGLSGPLPFETNGTTNYQNTLTQLCMTCTLDVPAIYHQPLSLYEGPVSIPVHSEYMTLNIANMNIKLLFL